MNNLGIEKLTNEIIVGSGENGLVLILSFQERCYIYNYPIRFHNFFRAYSLSECRSLNLNKFKTLYLPTLKKILAKVKDRYGVTLSSTYSIESEIIRSLIILYLLEHQEEVDRQLEGF